MGWEHTECGERERVRIESERGHKFSREHYKTHRAKKYDERYTGAQRTEGEVIKALIWENGEI